MIRYLTDIFGSSSILIDNEGQNVRPLDSIVGEKINPRFKEVMKKALFTSTLGKKIFTYMHEWNKNYVDSDINVEAYKVIHGHYDSTKYPDYTKVTVLREPLERALSHYAFLKLQYNIGNVANAAEKDWFDPEMTFDDYFRQDTTINFQARYLNVDDDLEKFELVGITEDLETYAQNLARFCRVESCINKTKVNVSPNRHTDQITADQRKEFYRYNQMDVDLYRIATQRHVNHTRELNP